MKTFNLIVKSKNKSIINDFVYFFIECLLYNSNSLKKQFKNKKNKKKIVILKSPHVNKQAQEQFEYHMFSKQIKIYSFHILKFLIFLKKIQLKLFPDIKFKISFYFLKDLKKIKLKTFSPDTFLYYLYNKKNLTSKNTQKITKIYLKLLDLYGEFIFK